MFATFGTITLLLVFLQNSVCLQGKTRSKRGFVFDSEEISGSSLSRVFDELIHLDNHLDDVKQSVIEHVHDHVETKLDHQEEILMQILNKQRYFQVCLLEGNPCDNGGTCYVEMEAESYTCACTDGWTGTNCREIDYCFGVECENEGLCYNGSCICAIGYTGEYCEIDELDCAGREGMFPISDCRSFLWCYAGGKHVQFCAAGTAFNAMTSVCDIHLNAYEECP